MGKVIEALTEKHEKFIRGLPVFFVATAPRDVAHRVNVSPRAPGASCVVADGRTVYWADLSGSGCETAAHVLENGRMTLLFVNILEGPPLMLRLHGRASIMLPTEVDDARLAQFPDAITASPGFRCVYRLDVERISQSCGYSMPVMTLDRFRTTLEEHSQKCDMDAYRALKNCFSIDALPSIALLPEQNKLLGPSPEDGYVFARPVNALDLAARRAAADRRATLIASPARATATPTTTTLHGTSSSAHVNNNNNWQKSATYMLVAAVPHLFAFLLGALACLGLQRYAGLDICF